MKLYRVAKLSQHEMFIDELSIYKIDLVLKVLSPVRPGSLPGHLVDHGHLVDYWMFS